MSETVAVIGAGPAGIAAARYLKGQGFAPVLFEAHDAPGGQWNRQNPRSGIWPEMRTNTARMVTKLSDGTYPEGTALFPRNGEVLAMLRALAERFGLLDDARFGAEVTGLCRDGAGWRVTWNDGAGEHAESFPRAVVATGRFNRPWAPEVPGLGDFSGALGVRHSFDYDGPEAWRGKRVVIAGGATSAVEIASDLAMAGAARVHVAQRRQRYVIPKVVAGVPIEYLGLTLGAARAAETAPPDRLAAERDRFIKEIGGNPAAYGCPPADPDVEKAGVTGCPYYLDLVAEDRITVHSWIARVEGRRVTFADGTAIEADGILMATGFRLSLPFLSDEIARTVRLSPADMELAEFTLHPDLPGLAFLGFWPQFGPYMVALEQQARFVAYAWGGAAPMPSDAALRAAVKPLSATGAPGGGHQAHVMALRFARLAGVAPPGTLARRAVLDRSPVTGETCRLTGPDADPGAERRLRHDFDLFAPADVRAGPAALPRRDGSDAA
ncbi:NAD(P)/FAD-dependent oxidoreductase [Rhodosalinus halophilus]|uniref:Trimethylamine monooxygenase n=1 Tax=Rhodosalinus halophilus TaxID=2259333 RepID=A0A365U5X6_9RHOB|nr:NAD(P)/FAD-dependent oxidoreductase [Rhodosalinus halophilus]RBI83824.1 NAD(P)/FAD-dependent oxidoreductase [Rhodosalinus halophilus]